MKQHPNTTEEITREIARLLVSLSSNSSIDFSTDFSSGYLVFEEYFNGLEKREETLANLMSLSQTITQALIRLYIKELKAKATLLNERLNAPLPEKRQQTFTSKETQQITGIKSKDTINKYLRKGIIKSHKDARGQYIIMREDLASYLGHNNF